MIIIAVMVVLKSEIALSWEKPKAKTLYILHDYLKELPKTHSCAMPWEVRKKRHSLLRGSGVIKMGR